MITVRYADSFATFAVSSSGSRGAARGAGAVAAVFAEAAARRLRVAGLLTS